MYFCSISCVTLTAITDFFDSSTTLRPPGPTVYNRPLWYWKNIRFRWNIFQAICCMKKSLARYIVRYSVFHICIESTEMLCVNRYTMAEDASSNTLNRHHEYPNENIVKLIEEFVIYLFIIYFILFIFQILLVHARYSDEMVCCKN